MAKGVESRKKTTTCQCGREIRVDRRKLKFLTDSPLVLANSVAEANAVLRGGGKRLTEKKAQPKGPYDAISDKARTAKDPVDRLRVVAQELTALKSEFGIADLAKVTSVLGRESAEKTLKRLQDMNMIYEVSPGRYRAV